jgi:superfamily II DNA/RNA helicase
MSFDMLGLGPDTLRAVSDAGYREPTPIQSQAIPIVLQGRDVLGCAQTGTGKTASFTLPMIEILSSGRARARMPRSLILTPTRELATQIANNFETYGKYHKLTKALLIGGVSMVDQRRLLDRGVDVLIATPGRMLDLFDRGSILLTGVKILVIDESDRMLDMGFIPDVERIVSLVSPIRQTLMFSATMPKEIKRLADKFLSSPKEIAVAPPASTPETVTQSVIVVDSRKKQDALRSLIKSEGVENALIFCNRKKDVDILDKSLRKHGLSSAALHGDMSQPARTETLQAFKDGKVTVLVATDVAGRGLDIQGLSHVFNFDVPMHAEDYVHRIGRTGRAGRVGRAFTIATPADAKYISAINALLGHDIPKIELESGASAAPNATDAAPARGRTRRAAAKPKAEKPASKTRPIAPPAKTEPAKDEAQKAEPRPNQQNKRKPEPAQDKGRVIGMGDHVPAFMLRPARTTG